MKIGIFIPGRLSSERLPNKLILPLGESNLWDMACKKLNDLPSKYNKYALCYDEQLINIAKKYPNLNVIIRDEKTALAETPLKYIFKEMEKVEDTHLMFLNPCLSFLTSETIVKSLECFEKNKYDYATSVKPFQNWIFDNAGSPLNHIDYEKLTTKEIKPIYQAAHCFHVFNKNNFFNDGMMLKPNHGLLPIPHEETIDVDDYTDYEYAKFKHAKKYVIDIDGTICTTTGTDYKNSEPILERIIRFNNLHEAGNTIWYQTARGYKTGIDWREITENQFKIWGVKFDKLLFNKPDADVYIDDKASNATKWR